jgi:predicted secreted protein
MKVIAIRAHQSPAIPGFSLKKRCGGLFGALAAALCSASVLFAPPASAQPMPRPVMQETANIVALSASGSVQITQDLLTIQLAATRDGADAQAVQTQLKALLDAALVATKAQAAPEQMEVRTGNFSMYPRYDRAGKINGWQGSAELVLEGRDFARISAAAGKVQGMAIQNVGFALSRAARLKAEAELEAQAIDSFKTKAERVAKLFGFNGYGLREVSVSSADQGFAPQPRMEMMQARGAAMADAAVPAEAGKTLVSVNVSGTVQLR